MITLIDSFNNRIISNHRSLLNAVKAQYKHLNQVKKHNGKNSYLTYSFVENGYPVDFEEIEKCKMKLYYV